MWQLGMVRHVPASGAGMAVNDFIALVAVSWSWAPQGNCRRPALARITAGVFADTSVPIRMSEQYSKRDYFIVPPVQLGRGT